MVRSKKMALVSFVLSALLASCGGSSGFQTSASAPTPAPTPDNGGGNGGGGGGGATPPPVMSTSWRDYSLMFNCSLSYSGANYGFGSQYRAFSQAITINQSQVGGVITGIYYPSGQTVSLYDDAGGDPGTLLATANASNYFDKSDTNGSMCCGDRTFAWYFPSFVNTTPGNTYHVVTTPNNSGEYTSFKVAWLQGGSCYSAQTMRCQKMDDTWENCQIPGGNFSVQLQDVMY